MQTDDRHQGRKDVAAEATTASDAAPLYPPAITPPDQPLPLMRFLREFPRNPLRSVPRAAYEREIFVLRPKFPKITYAWITGPELVEDVLISHAGDLQKSRVEKRVFAKSVGDSLLTADGHKWRWQRRVLAPLFRHQEIIGYVPAMRVAAERQVACWREEGHRIHNVEEDMSSTALAVIMATMLADNDRSVGERIQKGTDDYLSKASWEAAYAILGMPDWFPHPGSWRMASSSRSLRAIMKNLIEARRNSGAQHDDLLGRLLAARDPETGEPMDDVGLINNLSTLLLAGHETTAKALTWTLYLLARAPNWQMAVRGEVEQVTQGALVSAEHIDRLTLTTRVLKESMRLYPPAPVIARTNTTFLRAGDEDLPAGSNIVFPVYAIHRHRKFWHDPDRFEPDRFLPQNEKAIRRTQYMPFGAGQRICLGQSFALVEAVALLATFVRSTRFAWDGNHAPEPISRVTLRPSGGMPLEVIPL